MPSCVLSVMSSLSSTTSLLGEINPRLGAPGSACERPLFTGLEGLGRHMSSFLVPLTSPSSPIIPRTASSALWLERTPFPERFEHPVHTPNSAGPSIGHDEEFHSSMSKPQGQMIPDLLRLLQSKVSDGSSERQMQSIPPIQKNDETAPGPDEGLMASSLRAQEIAVPAHQLETTKRCSMEWYTSQQTFLRPVKPAEGTNGAEEPSMSDGQRQTEPLRCEDVEHAPDQFPLFGNDWPEHLGNPHISSAQAASPRTSHFPFHDLGAKPPVMGELPLCFVAPIFLPESRLCSTQRGLSASRTVSSLVISPPIEPQDSNGCWITSAASSSVTTGDKLGGLTYADDPQSPTLAAAAYTSTRTSFHNPGIPLADAYRSDSRHEVGYFYRPLVTSVRSVPQLCNTIHSHTLDADFRAAEGPFIVASQALRPSLADQALHPVRTKLSTAVTTQIDTEESRMTVSGQSPVTTCSLSSLSSPHSTSLSVRRSLGDSPGSSLSEAVTQSAEPERSPSFISQQKASSGKSRRRKQNPRFACNRCGSVFTSKTNLRSHGLTHDGVRPYTCEHAHCSKQFTRESDLRRHTKTHAPNRKLYGCTKCKREYTRKDTMRGHEKTCRAKALPPDSGWHSV